MKNLSGSFFNENEIVSIESTVREAESKTSGEIVAMVVDRSDSYRDIDYAAGLIIAAVISIFPSELFYAASDTLIRKVFPSIGWLSQTPDGLRYISGLTMFIILTVMLHFPIKYLLRRFPALKRLFIPVKRIDDEVRERALRAFHEHGLSATRDATGVLFMISILERKVYVLADRGIYSKIKQETLDKYASSISIGIKTGRGCDALCEAVKDAGNELSKYFPKKNDDVNELPDRVITEK